MAFDFFRRGPVLIVAAHPDDETIGVGGQLGFLNDSHIIHVTDGAPRSTPSHVEYARMRRRELEAAMATAGIDGHRCLAFGCVDQETPFSLDSLTHLLSDRLREMRPKIVLTHSYEGGHPDHDSCAFIVQAAVNMSEPPPLRVEFTSYHNGSPNSNSSCMKVGEFLPGASDWVIDLPPPVQQRKRRMLACFESQQHVLREFPLENERFRLAPRYDFTKAPHSGNLYYDDKNWGVTGPEWRKLALTAARGLRCFAGA